ncbi:MAG: hypothetical protein KBS83_04300, partial [Lachnospiraceae bacterium]|nr:hypothetical protein [Candidatus Equihabitans merdae]
EMMGEVERFDDLYDQTASKTEQLALCSFIRDDHIYRQIKRLRKVYQLKRGLLKDILESLAKDLPDAEVLSGESGTEMLIRGSGAALEVVLEKTKGLNVSCKELSADDQGKTTALLFSCGVIESSALQELKEACDLL